MRRGREKGEGEREVCGISREGIRVRRGRGRREREREEGKGRCAELVERD